MGKADMHVHSKYSFDSKTKIKEIIEVAEKKKLDYVAITDHIEFANQPINEVIHRIKNRNNKIDELQNTTKVKLIKSVEISEPHLYSDEVDQLLENNDIELDLIIGSIHHVLGMPIRKMVEYQNVYNMYLQSMLKMVESANIDTVAHLDYLKRYLQSGQFDEDLLEDVIDAIIENKLTLEVNTSGIRRCGEPFPSTSILDIYAKHGGRNISIGSDAHIASEIADNFKEIDLELQEYPFNEGVTIKRRFKKI